MNRTRRLFCFFLFLLPLLALAPYLNGQTCPTPPNVSETSTSSACHGTTNELGCSGRFIGMVDQDKADLKAFLETLTDEKFLRDPKFSNPF
jgi:hypothetical protein